MLKKTDKSLLCLLIILCLASFFRFYNLAKESLLTDEFYSYYLAHWSISDILTKHQDRLNPNTLPPLYEILLSFWIKIAGTGDGAQRILSAFFGVLAVYCVYLLTKLLYGKKTGLAASFIFSFSYLFLSISRQSRCYSMFVFLSLLSWYLLFYALKKRTLPKGFFLGLSLTNCALLYTHYFSFIILFLQFVIVCVECRKTSFTKEKKTIILAHLSSLLLFSPWLQNFLFDFNREPVLNNSGSLISTLRLLTILFRLGIGNFSGVILGIYIFFVAVAIWKSYQSKDRFTLYLLIIFIVPSLFIYILTNQASTQRYYTSFLFPLLVLAGKGINHFKGKRLIILCALFFFSSHYLYRVLQRPVFHEKWKQYAEYIRKFHAEKKEKMVLLVPFAAWGVFSYYFFGKEKSLSLYSVAPYASFIAPRDFAISNQYINEDNITIFVYGYILQSAEEKEKLFHLASENETTWIWFFSYHIPPKRAFDLLSLSFKYSGRIFLENDPHVRILLDLFVNK